MQIFSLNFCVNLQCINFIYVINDLLFLKISIQIEAKNDRRKFKFLSYTFLYYYWHVYGFYLWDYIYINIGQHISTNKSNL